MLSLKSKFRLAQLLLGALFFATGSLCFYLQSFLPVYISLTPFLVWLLIVLYLQNKFLKCPNCGESLSYQGDFLGFRLYGGLSVDNCNACGFDLIKKANLCKTDSVSRQ